MPKDTKKQQGSGLLDPTPETENNSGISKEGEIKVETKPKKGSKVHRLSQQDGLYRPKEKEEGEKKSPPLTVKQYLAKVKLDDGISGLVQSLHGKKIMRLEEWEKLVSSLLKKQTR